MPVSHAVPLPALTGNLVLQNVPFVGIIDDAGWTCWSDFDSTESSTVMSEKVEWSASQPHTDPEIRLQQAGARHGLGNCLVLVFFPEDYEKPPVSSQKLLV